MTGSAHTSDVNAFELRAGLSSADCDFRLFDLGVRRVGHQAHRNEQHHVKHGAHQPGGRVAVVEFVPNDDRVSPPDAAAANQELAVTQDLQKAIWSQGLAAARGAQPATMLLLPALNDMFDIVTSRTMALMLHPPGVVFGMLFGLSLIAAVLAGYNMTGVRTSERLRMWAFAASRSFVNFP